MGKVINFEEGKRKILLKRSKMKIDKKRKKYKYNFWVLAIILILCFTTLLTTVNYQNSFQSTNLLEKKIGMSLF